MPGEPTLPLVPVDEYLTTSYEQDVEFVMEGWLRRECSPVRTSYSARFCYRLPDVMVFTPPVSLSRVMTKVPNVVIEILSPNDRQAEILDRFEDYENIGVAISREVPDPDGLPFPRTSWPS